ncbi:MAG: hypothetical protein AAGD09_03640 [Cyanobacteria bacterium P01_F01_bin.56]
MNELVCTPIGYPTPQNYERLWELAQQQSVICLVESEDDGIKTNVAQTLSYEGTVNVATPGICYVTGYDKARFIESCKKCKLQWLVPS